MTEREYKEHIYAKAKEVKTQKDLGKLIDEIGSYNHDYGTIVYGCMAAMKAAFNVVNNSPNGGITGFQAGCLGWECVREFMMVDGPLRLIDYSNMLYPQYADSFQSTITRECWAKVQEKAGERLKVQPHANPTVVAHWQSIVDGKIPFGMTVMDH